MIELILIPWLLPVDEFDVLLEARDAARLEAAVAVEVEIGEPLVIEAPAPEPHVHEEPAAADPSAAGGTVWDQLAECESGEWVDGGASFVPGSARWSYGVDFTHPGYEQFEGGLNFAASTWDSYRDEGMPEHAGLASREQQILVAERVLADQGWQAWPTCSRKLGLR